MFKGIGRIWGSTHSDIELNNTPKNQHGRVTVSKLDTVDLQVSEDGAESGEETEGENANQTKLLLLLDVELEEQWHRQDSDHHVGDDSYNGVGREGGAGRETCAILERVP